MAPKNRIIIDTDPGMTIKFHSNPERCWLTLTLGVDDVLALLLALSASPDELEVVMISVTYGNVEIQRHVEMFRILRLMLIHLQLPPKRCCLVPRLGERNGLARVHRQKNLRGSAYLQAHRCCWGRTSS